MLSYRHKGLRAELDRLRDGLESLAQVEQACVILYEIDRLRRLPETEQEQYIAQLVEQREAELEQQSTRLSSRKRQQASTDTGAVVLLPMKGSYTLEETQIDEQT
jgi:metal-dependent amidase/aminoacylase/carboxypeptidase family protein